MTQPAPTGTLQRRGHDRLRELLDVIVASTSELGVDGAELARRAHLSRFHFDRLVAASLGEPPGAFRRRLLLERAAYRLVAGDAPVTDLALESGYGSPRPSRGRSPARSAGRRRSCAATRRSHCTCPPPTACTSTLPAACGSTATEGAARWTS